MIELVAELSGNHHGSPEELLLLIDLAQDAGADAVKLQCFDPDRMAAPGDVLKAGLWAGQDLHKLYLETRTHHEWIERAFTHANEIGMPIFASVFHPEDVDFMETLDCPRYKMASTRLNDRRLLARIVETGKPIIMSTGMATFHDIEDAVGWASTDDLTLLVCTSAYPCPPNQIRIANVRHLIHRHGQTGVGRRDVKIGFSDHSLTLAAPLIAAHLGAQMIEVHLTRNRAMGGPDSTFSYEPDELGLIREELDVVEAMPLTPFYGPTPDEQPLLGLKVA